MTKTVQDGKEMMNCKVLHVENDADDHLILEIELLGLARLMMTMLLLNERIIDGQTLKRMKRD